MGEDPVLKEKAKVLQRRNCVPREAALAGSFGTQLFWGWGRQAKGPSSLYFNSTDQ
jgi:hypothetical protein